jgi:type IV secretion system protein TrbE
MDGSYIKTTHTSGAPFMRSHRMGGALHGSANRLLSLNNESHKTPQCSFLLQNAQKYAPLTFIFDIGGSFQSLTSIFGGNYLNVDQEARDSSINPFSLGPTKENLKFLFSFFRVLIEGNGRRYRLDFKEERRLWDGIECMYVREPEQCTVSNFGNIVGELNERLHRWTRGGQYGFLFDNAEDTLSFSHFQTFNFAGWGHAPDVLEPLDFPLPSSRMSVWQLRRCAG